VLAERGVHDAAELRAIGSALALILTVNLMIIHHWYVGNGPAGGRSNEDQDRRAARRDGLNERARACWGVGEAVPMQWMVSTEFKPAREIYSCRRPHLSPPTDPRELSARCIDGKVIGAYGLLRTGHVRDPLLGVIESSADIADGGDRAVARFRFKARPPTDNAADRADLPQQAMVIALSSTSARWRLRKTWTGGSSSTRRSRSRVDDLE